MIVLAQMVIRARRLRYAVVEQHRGLVTNAVRIPISIVVAVRDIVAEAELLVTVNIPHVTAQADMSGMVVLVSVTVVSNMLVAVWGKQARELLVEESIRLVYVQVIMFRFVV